VLLKLDIICTDFLYIALDDLIALLITPACTTHAASLFAIYETILKYILHSKFFITIFNFFHTDHYFLFLLCDTTVGNVINFFYIFY
jgi:hypothetical protein